MREIIKRPRRNRVNASIRDLVAETSLSAKDLVWPLFILPGNGKKIEIKSMPGVFRWSLDQVLPEIQNAYERGIRAVALFPCIEESQKDRFASESHREGAFYFEAIQKVKSSCAPMVVITDVAMDPYSSDGHDGIVEDGKILNDETLDVLCKMAVCQAKAGADLVAPSDMMDGRVGAIRRALDINGFKDTGILSYTAKYCSGFYGPFREALDSAPKSGDKKTYQMNPANRKEALRELRLDLEEGADMVMVKPALAYLDIISDLKAHSDVPVVAYQVSGEYSMLKAASAAGYMKEQDAFLECLTSIKRAGADLILSYWAKDFVDLRRG